MQTARDIVYRAFSYDLNRAAEAQIEDDELADGIAVLNDLMTQWESLGYNFGFTYITDASQQVTVPIGAILGITQALALQLAPMFGGKTSALLVKNAEANERRAKALAMEPPSFAFPSTLPRGMGRRWWNQTYDVFFDGKVIPVAQMSLSANTTNTTISAVDTPVAIAGTWTKLKDTRFTITDAGLITYTGEETRNFDVQAQFTTTVAAKHVNFYVYVNSIKIEPSKTGDYVGTTAIIPLFFKMILKKNDTVQFFVENIDDTTDILISDAMTEVS